MKPNILWIGVDQMRADSLGVHNTTICQTPNLNQLAKNSVLFSRAYTPCSLCSPARASMLTGQFAFHHGMGTNCDMYHVMASELPNFHNLLHYKLQKIGYRTGYTGKWHVGAKLGPGDYGFDGLSIPGYGDLTQHPKYQQYLSKNKLVYDSLINPIYGNPNQKTLIAGRWNGTVESTPAYYLANTTIALLEDFAHTWQTKQQPFFLTCQFWAPHPPYLPSLEFSGRHDSRDIPQWRNFEDNLRGKPQSVKRFRRDFYRSLPRSWDAWREIIALSYDFTTMLDAQIGRILTRLDELNLSDQTMVVFTSDHGDMLGSHGGLFDKGFMYEEAHRVPLLIRLPGNNTQTRIANNLVYNMDIMPTILDFIDEELDQQVNGQSLLPILTDANAKGREDIYLEFHGLRCLHTQRALVTDDGWKYIFTPVDQDEVYNLNDDPGELINLIGHPDYQDVIMKLQQRMIAAAIRSADPEMDYISKLFGNWENLSGQPDPSSAQTKGRW